jgi:hypothetical protein
MSNLNSPFLTEYGKVITPIVYLTALILIEDFL